MIGKVIKWKKGETKKEKTKEKRKHKDLILAPIGFNSQPSTGKQLFIKQIHPFKNALLHSFWSAILNTVMNKLQQPLFLKALLCSDNYIVATMKINSNEAVTITVATAKILRF